MALQGETGAPVLKWNAVGVSAGAVAERAAGPVTFVLSTDEVDRHGDVVCADGWRLEAYRENPVLLWAHDYHHPAIGRAVSVWTEPHRLLAKVEFAPSGFAQDVAALYAAGFQWGRVRGLPAHPLGGTAGLAQWGVHRSEIPGAGTAGGERGAGASQPQRVAAGGRSRMVGWAGCWRNCGRRGSGNDAKTQRLNGLGGIYDH